MSLHPPTSTSQAKPSSLYNQHSNATFALNANNRQEEGKEEEDDDDEEVIVEQQLNDPNLNDHDAPASLPPDHQPFDSLDPTAHAQASAHAPPVPIMQVRPSGPDIDNRQQKCRPGRPRGSKNKPCPSASDASQKQQAPPPLFYTYKPTPQNQAQRLSAAAPHPDVNAKNQQYYEFQWRVLNLCAESYGAAQELVKATPPLVLAQCYDMGPTNKIDPLIILAEAKRVCNTLLANPSQLIVNPPPPIMPTYTLQQQPSPPQPQTIIAPPVNSALSVITNPQTFVIPLSTQPAPAAYPHLQYPAMYPPAQYPTASYYAFPEYAPPVTIYPSAPQQPKQQMPSQRQQQPLHKQTTVVSATSDAPGIDLGSWSDEETERLRKLAEQSRSVSTIGKIEWDWVVHQWGTGRTWRQILTKATAVGLKESSSRGAKRRRGNDTGHREVHTMSTPTTMAYVTNAAPVASTRTIRPSTLESPTPGRAASTPGGSPIVRNQTRSPGQSSTPIPRQQQEAVHNMPWPMPTIAALTPSPVVMTSGAGLDARGESRSQTTLLFVYQTNGWSKENSE